MELIASTTNAHDNPAFSRKSRPISKEKYTTFLSNIHCGYEHPL